MSISFVAQAKGAQPVDAVPVKLAVRTADTSLLDAQAATDVGFKAKAAVQLVDCKWKVLVSEAQTEGLAADKDKIRQLVDNLHDLVVRFYNGKTIVDEMPLTSLAYAGIRIGGMLAGAEAANAISGALSISGGAQNPVKPQFRVPGNGSWSVELARLGGITYAAGGAADVILDLTFMKD